MKIDGCDAYPLKFQGNFEAMAKQNCIMIRYCDKAGIYWILEKETQKIFKSRDVRFNESKIVSEKLHESGIFIDMSGKLIETESILRENEVKNQDLPVNEVQQQESTENKGQSTQNVQVKSQERIEILQESDNTSSSDFLTDLEQVKEVNTLEKPKSSTREKKQTQFYQSGESETKKRSVQFSLIISCGINNDNDEPGSI